MSSPDYDDTPGQQRIGAAPSRAERIFHDLLAMAQSALSAQLAVVFDAANDELFKRAEKAQSNDAQQNLFESMREIKRRRTEFDLNFNNLLRESFTGLKDKAKHFRVAPQADLKAREKGKSKLSLVDNSDLEESLMLDELVAKAEIRQSQELWALSQRLGVLAGSAALDLGLIPAGPQSLAQILRQAAQVFEMSAAGKVLIYKGVDREVMAKLGDLLGAMNAQLVRAKILPNLAFEENKAEPEARKPAQPEVPAEEDPLQKDAEPAPNPLPAPSSRQGSNRATERPQSSAGAGGFAPRSGGNPATQGPSMQPADPAQAGHAAAEALSAIAQAFSGLSQRQNAPRTGFSLPGGLGELVQPRPANQAASSVAKSVDWNPAFPTEIGSRDEEMFDTIRELLGGRRRAMASFGRTSEVGNMPTKAVSSEDVQSVLSVLQSKPHTLSVGGKQVPRTISHIKQEMTQALRSLDPESRQPQLSEVDGDTFDLVGMLFDFVLKDLGRNGVTHNMLTRLQVPVLKVALQDKSFFTRREHPARAFLNAIAEAGQLWAEHDDGDTQLVENMQILVERALEDFDQDSGVFDTLLGDLTKHINVLTRKADVSERRHVEASKGRERLDLAKEEARAAIARLVNDRQPPKMVQQLLEQAWADVLSLLNLRHGAQSPEYQGALKTADRVIDSVTPNQGGERRRELKSESKALNTQIERGLAQVGFAESEAQALIKNLESCQVWALADGQTQAVPQQLLKPIAVAKTRLGKDSAEQDKKDAAKAPPALPLTQEEKAMLDRIKQIPFGSWFDFVVNQQGVKARRKLSWFSPVSSKCLFVNARGVKVDERSMENLARDMVRGVAMIVDETQGNMIDRAFGTIVRTLKQLTQRPQAAPAA